ncbi:uncharacterized protein LOC106052013 [Biomphalaria glabrata]|uniref:Uncharacterized protein LOC106052013 n=1 Tax=Biomphalaria glabrata TaxID=6526 RepID=A0A9W2ZDF9_BIOGL|nr:uncharacterized protein LOC106052013 [Biomphalaria glabrata]
MQGLYTERNIGTDKVLEVTIWNEIIFLTVLILVITRTKCLTPVVNIESVGQGDNFTVECDITKFSQTPVADYLWSLSAQAKQETQKEYTTVATYCPFLPLEEQQLTRIPPGRQWTVFYSGGNSYVNIDTIRISIHVMDGRSEDAGLYRCILITGTKPQKTMYSTPSHLLAKATTVRTTQSKSTNQVSTKERKRRIATKVHTVNPTGAPAVESWKYIWYLALSILIVITAVLCFLRKKRSKPNVTESNNLDLNSKAPKIHVSASSYGESQVDPVNEFPNTDKKIKKSSSKNGSQLTASTNYNESEVDTTSNTNS